MERMSREQFFAAVTGLDRDQLRRVLWQAYWRGPAQVRARIEAELHPEGAGPARSAPPAVDADAVLAEVEDFAALARSGAYLAGSRKVSPKERSRWRFTFRRLVADVRLALREEPITAGAAAMATVIDLACETLDADYFRSDDPVAAAGLVVSDEAGLLWARIREASGFATFAQVAAAQLIRWESPYGWTRHGDGRVAARESALADVLAGMLPVPDAWVTFAGCYLDALDHLASPASGSGKSRRSVGRARDERTESLARWHRLLLDRLVDTEGEALLDRLATHPALGGPELTFFQAHLAHRRGKANRARRLLRDALRTLPGHPEFLALADEIGESTPPSSGNG